MRHVLCILALLVFICLGCTSQKTPPQQPAASSSLKKIMISSEQQLVQLEATGAEIIVREPDYAVVRADSLPPSLTLSLQPLRESDLVQRLIRMRLADRNDLQQVVDTGLDLWEVQGDTVIARAFDIHIKQLEAMGYTIEILARNAQNWKGERQ